MQKLLYIIIISVFLSASYEVKESYIPKTLSWRAQRFLKSKPTYLLRDTHPSADEIWDIYLNPMLRRKYLNIFKVNGTENQKEVINEKVTFSNVQAVLNRMNFLEGNDSHIGFVGYGMIVQYWVFRTLVYENEEATDRLKHLQISSNTLPPIHMSHGMEEFWRRHKISPYFSGRFYLMDSVSPFSNIVHCIQNTHAHLMEYLIRYGGASKQEALQKVIPIGISEPHYGYDLSVSNARYTVENKRLHSVSEYFGSIKKQPEDVIYHPMVIIGDYEFFEQVIYSDGYLARWDDVKYKEIIDSLTLITDFTERNYKSIIANRENFVAFYITLIDKLLSIYNSHPFGSYKTKLLNLLTNHPPSIDAAFSGQCKELISDYQQLTTPL